MQRLSLSSLSVLKLRLLLSTSARSLSLKVGDKLPAVELVEGPDMKKVNTQQLFAGSRNILFGVPGAFTPTCSKVHLPSYVNDFDKIKAKGVANVFCLSVNDPFVMQAWAEASNAVGKVRMLSDTQAIFVRATDLALDLTHVLGGMRAKRFAMLIEDGTVKQIHIESDPTKASCTIADSVLKGL